MCVCTTIVISSKYTFPICYWEGLNLSQDGHEILSLSLLVLVYIVLSFILSNDTCTYI